jgi:hypothetical protein
MKKGHGKKVKLPKELSPQRKRRELITQCLGFWGKIIRARDKRCVWCGSVDRLTAHHIVARGIAPGMAQFDYRNGMTLCYKCHIHRLPAEPDEYIRVRDEFLKTRIGYTYEYLRTIYRAPSKLCTADLRIVLIDLERTASKLL